MINYDYEWQGPCRRFGLAAFYLLVFAGAAKALAIVAFYRRAYVVLDTRQGNNRITDTPFWRWAGAITEFACFCAMLGLTIQFYSTCWSYFPSAGNRMFFPVKDFTEEQRIAGTYPYTSAICISISAVLSLAISVIHFRMPCWEAETKDPEWFY